MGHEDYKEKYDNLKEQFDSFTYTVSHDLRAPLRHLREFTRILLSTIENPTDEQQESAHFIIKAAAQSDSMLETILAYSRLSTRQIPFSTFSSEDLFIHSRHILLPLIQERDAIIILPKKYPQIYGNIEQLTNMATYMIENAIKFTDKNKIPKIHINIKEKKEEVIISFKDNGIGIEEKYHKSIFNIFKQIDPESPGIGKGLLFSKKIVENHGGNIWLESDFQSGSVFYISLPR